MTKKLNRAPVINKATSVPAQPPVKPIAPAISRRVPKVPKNKM